MSDSATPWKLSASGGQRIGVSASASVLNEYSGLISFRIDSFDHLAVQRTFRSLLQQHNLKASLLWCSAFLMVHLTHPYMTTAKTTALTRWTFVSKVMCLLRNTLSRYILRCSNSCHYCYFLLFNLVRFSSDSSLRNLALQESIRRAQNASPTESAPLRTTRVPEPERLGPGRYMQPRAGLGLF